MKWLALMIALMVVACGKGDDTAGGASDEAPVAGMVAPQVLDRVGKASAFEQTAAKPYAALACARGEVEELDVLVCSYPDAGSAEAALKSLREFVAGALSGVVRQSGNDLVAIADRKEVDPKGERISRIVGAFLK